MLLMIQNIRQRRTILFLFFLVKNSYQYKLSQILI